MVILKNEAATNKQTFNNNYNMTTTKKVCHVKKSLLLRLRTGPVVDPDPVGST
jgi:hypothetical protein